jgi:hypothetical protein
MYNKDISKEELAEHILQGWMPEHDFPKNVMKFIEDNIGDIPWLDLHVVVKKDLLKVGISSVESAKIGKGLSGFQKIAGVTILVITSGSSKIGIYHDALRLRAIKINGSNAEEGKKDIAKKIKPAFVEVEEKVVKASPAKKKRTKKQIKEAIEEAIEDAVEDAMEDAIEEIIEDVLEEIESSEEIAEEKNDDE